MAQDKASDSYYAKASKLPVNEAFIFVNATIRDCYIIKPNGTFFNEIGCIYPTYHILH